MPGVAEVASVGGFVRQYQVEGRSQRLAAYGISLSEVRHAIQRSNNDVGGRLIEMAETEFMVRGRGYIESIEDLEQVAVGTDGRGTPVLPAGPGPTSMPGRSCGAASRISMGRARWLPGWW